MEPSRGNSPVDLSTLFGYTNHYGKYTMNKIILAIVAVLLSAYLGLFILPRKVETTRWVKVDVPEEIVWKEVSDVKAWNTWQPWATSEAAEPIPWDDGVVSNINVVNDKSTGVKEVQFDVEPNAQGRLYLEKIPDGLWVRCEYIFEAPYAPVGRLTAWFHRSEIALNLDTGLEALQRKLQNIQSNQQETP